MIKMFYRPSGLPAKQCRRAPPAALSWRRIRQGTVTHGAPATPASYHVSISNLELAGDGAAEALQQLKWRHGGAGVLRDFPLSRCPGLSMPRQ